MALTVLKIIGKNVLKGHCGLLNGHRWESFLKGHIAVAMKTTITNIVDIPSHTRPKTGCSCLLFHRRHVLMSSMKSFKNNIPKQYRYNDTVTIQNNTIKKHSKPSRKERYGCMKREFDTSPQKSDSIAIIKACLMRGCSLSGPQYHAFANKHFQKFRVE